MHMLYHRGGWKNGGVGMWGVLTIAAIAMMIPVATARADGMLTGWIVKVAADKGAIHDEYVTYFSGESLPEGGWFDWSLPSPYTFANGLGQLQTLNLSLNERCYEPDALSVELAFSLVAGTSGATFTVTSAMLPITVVNPQAYATAGVTVTDGEPYDTATLLGKYPGDKVYQTSYNNGIPWRTYIASPLVTGTGGTASSPAEPIIQEMIPATVTNISSEFKFTLTPVDQASGTSSFTILVPEPVTIGLLAIGAVFVGRRKR